MSYPTRKDWEKLDEHLASAGIPKPSTFDCKCIGCHKPPSEIAEYIEAAESEDMTPEEYVKSEEGTYNRSNGHFACTDCYFAMGMPSSPTGWKAP